MPNALRKALRRFAGETGGNVSIEAVIFLPLILATLAATFSLFDAFRYKSLNVKAAYTISDAISRQTDPLDDAYLDGMVGLLEFLTRSEGPYSLRVTQVRYDADTQQYVSEWSRTRGTFDGLTDQHLMDLHNRLPEMLHNERVIVVETGTTYEPPFDVAGLLQQDLFYNYGFTRPRFAPKVVWANG
jgi:hypothetical protein